MEFLMAEEIVKYENTLFGALRSYVENDEVFFNATDVCRALEIVNVSQACSKLSEKQKGIYTVYTLGGEQDALYINESGLYKLAFTSRKPEAEKFTDWVTSEVLPSIRKTGVYRMQSLSLGEQLLQQAQAYVALEREQAKQRTEQLRLSTSIQALEDKTEQMEETLANHRDESSWQPITDYWRLMGDRVDAKQASSLGKKAVALSNEKGVRVIRKRQADAAHPCNIYHPDILAMVYGKWKIEQNQKRLNPKMNSFSFNN